MISLDENNIRKTVMQLSIPSVMEQALMMVVGVVSTVFVGQIGKEAVSAVGLVNTLFNFIMVLFTALSTGCTVLVARLIGEAEQEKARETVKQSVVLGAALALLVSVLCYFGAKGIVNLFFWSAEQQVKGLAIVYFKITLYTLPLTLINIMISGTLRGAGDTRTPMIIGYIVNFINVLLGYILIFGVDLGPVHILPAGIAGAAAAVSIARAAGGIISILVILSPKSILRIKLAERYRVNLELVGRMLHVGIPAALEQVVMQGGFLVLQVLISGMGTVAIAVYQIVMSINSICFVPVWGFGIAATTLTGQCLGAQKPELAERFGWYTLKVSIGVISLLTIVVFIFSRGLMAVYTHDPDVIAMGAAAIRIFSISQPFLAVVVVISGALRGAGDIFYVMITSFVGIWAFRILLTVVLNALFHMGITGIWIALCMDFIIRAAMYIQRYRRGRWKLIQV